MNTVPPSSHSLTRTIFRFLAILGCVIILLLAILPTLVSTDWGKKQVQNTLNNKIPGHVQIGTLSIGWFGPQLIHGITLQDEKNSTIATIDEISADASLFALMLKKEAAGLFQVKNLNATIMTDINGVTNIQKALDKECCPSVESASETIHLSSDPMKVNNMQLLVNLTDNGQPLAVKMSGETLHHSLKGNFSILAELVGISSKQLLEKDFDFTHLKNYSPTSELKINADIANFPVALVDQLVSYQSPHYTGLLLQALGQELNMTIKQTTTANNQLLSLKANTPNLDAIADVILTKGIVLSQPATITFKATPALFDVFTKDFEKLKFWKLNETTLVKLVVEALEIPLSTLDNLKKDSPKRVNLEPIGLAARLTIDKTFVTNKSLNKNLSIEQFLTSILTKVNEKTVKMTVQGNASYSDEPVKINLVATLPKKLDWQDVLNTFLKQLSIKGDLLGIPLSLVDDELGLKGLLMEGAGTKGDLSIVVAPYDDKPLATFQFVTDKVKLMDLAFWLDENRVTLQKPTKLVFLISPSLVKKALPDQTLVLQKDTTAYFLLQNFILPVNFSHDAKPLPLFAFDQLTMEGNLNVSPLMLSEIPSIGAATLSEILLEIKALQNKPIKIDATASLTQPNDQGVLVDTLGKKTVVKASCTIFETHHESTSLNGYDLQNLNFQLTSDLAKISLAASHRDANRLMLNGPITVDYLITDNALNAMGATTDHYVFESKLPLKMTIAMSHIPRNQKEFAVMRMDGKIKLQDLELKQKSKETSLAALNDLDINWLLDVEKQQLKFVFSSLTQLGQQAAGKLNGLATVSNWYNGKTIDFKKAVVHIETETKNLPTEMVTTLMGKKELLPIIGNAINLAIISDLSMESGSEGSFSIDLKAPHLSGSASFDLKNNIFHLKDKRYPAEFTLDLTTQAYTVLRRLINKDYNGKLSLAEPVTTSIKINSLSLPVFQNKEFLVSYWLADLDATLFIDKIIGVDNKTKQKVILNDVKGKVSSKNVSKHVDFSFTAKGSNEKKDGIWNIAGSVDNAFSSSGELNLNALSLNFDAKIHALQVPLLCQLVCSDDDIYNQVKAIVGDSLDANIRAQLTKMNGPILIDLKGKNGEILIDAHIKDNILTLNKDFHSQLKITPEIGQYVLQHYVPIMDGILSADQPLKFTIESQGFSLPIKDTKVSNITMRRAILELGKVHFSSKAELAKILSLLKSDSSDTFAVWITPTYLSLNKGLVSIQRVDLLINNSYPAAAWGDVDLANDRVKMVVGLSGAALTKAFKVSGIPNDFLLQLPLTGTLKKASLDKTTAATRIASIVAQTQGGPQGMVVGTIIDLASGGLKDRTPPKPTTNPLPWAAMYENNESTKDSSTKDKNDPTNTPTNSIEEIKKGAGSLIKKLFK